MGGGPAQDFLLAALPWPEPKAILDRLRTRFPALEIVFIRTSVDDRSDPEKLRSRIPDHLWRSATILVTLFNFPRHASDVPRLDLVHLFSAGSEHIQNEPVYKDSDVVITTSNGAHGPQIAEWVIMTGLVASHKYKHFYELQKKHLWQKSLEAGKEGYVEVQDRVNTRIGILGYGSIGRQIGRVAKAMAMDVIAYTATPKDTDEKKRDRGFIVPGTGDEEGKIPSEWYSGTGKDQLRHFLRQNIDWLVVSVPLTPQTKHMLSEQEFSALSHGGKRPAFVTNIARGAIIDQPAMVEALKNGTLTGAALDVTDPEPLPQDSELWDMENVIVTPHVSAASTRYTERVFQLLEMNLHLREKGEKLINVVRRDRGY